MMHTCDTPCQHVQKGVKLHKIHKSTLHCCRSISACCPFHPDWSACQPSQSVNGQSFPVHTRRAKSSYKAAHQLETRHKVRLRPLYCMYVRPYSDVHAERSNLVRPGSLRPFECSG